MVLEVAEARAQVTTSLSDSDLSEVITREEAWLAKRIGPLTGERTEKFVAPDGDEVLQLRRPASATLTVTDASGAVDTIELRGWSDVVRTEGWWSTPVSVTYTPNDEDEVKRSLVTLVRLAVSESGYSGENQQGYSYSQDHTMRRRMRWEAWGELLRPAVPASTRLRSAIPAGGDTLQGVSTTAADGS